jgi:hypothetical protein
VYGWRVPTARREITCAGFGIGSQVRRVECCEGSFKGITTYHFFICSPFLHMGQQPSMNSLGVVGMLAERCKTVKQGLKMLCKYNETFTNLFTLSLDLSGPDAVFDFNRARIASRLNVTKAVKRT